MVQKFKKKKSRKSIFITFLLIAGITFFVCKYIVIPENSNILEEEYGNKILPNLSSDTIPKPSVSISSDKLSSSNAILIRLDDCAVLMQKIAKKEFTLLL